MNKLLLISSISIASFLAGATLVTPIRAQQEEAAPQQPAAHNMSQGSNRLQSLMKESKSMADMPLTGNTDVDFAKLMAEHHGMAIKMIDVELSYGRTPGLKALAKKMRAAQVRERAQLQRYAAARQTARP